MRLTTKSFVLIMSLFVVLTACDIFKPNDETPNDETTCTDVQLPGDYFPAYPKSWWKYYNINNKLVEYRISDDYEECHGKCLPLFENINKCVDGASLVHDFYAGLGQTATLNSPIYSTTIGDTLVCPVSFSTFKHIDFFTGNNDIPYRRVATVLDTSIAVNGVIYDSVLVVYECNIFDSLHRYYDYFAKNIGLIKRDSVNANDSTELIEILRLEDYHVDN